MVEKKINRRKVKGRRLSGGLEGKKINNRKGKGKKINKRTGREDDKQEEWKGIR